MKNEKLPVTFVIVIFCLIAINMAIQPPEYEEFQMTEIQLTEYNSGGFTLLINDHRPNREYITTIYANDDMRTSEASSMLQQTLSVARKQLTTTLKNGSNFIKLNSTGKVKIEIYDPENEFNGYGSKPNPWILTYTSE